MIWIVVGAIALSPFVVMALCVDDWSRDLTTNRAWTDPASADPTLTPLSTVCDWTDVSSAVDAFAETHAAWSRPDPPALLPEDSPIHEQAAAGPGGKMQFHLVRRSSVFGFRDDVWVVAKSEGPETWRLHIESRSRVGKGDLGQNPRNLRELRAWLDAELPH